ncbi:hypothetical protein PRZ48_012267 [Zasmidium cellare]|uniref:Methyltransferase domain-containing protein n=1 Tax=Zasmidium cellare TaxID=395010 RepID=A0ABR0E4C6_ZASCE|nr:hypothetical protein PRZ48_012267 [Zasmidium cellare]
MFFAVTLFRFILGFILCHYKLLSTILGLVLAFEFIFTLLSPKRKTGGSPLIAFLTLVPPFARRLLTLLWYMLMLMAVLAGFAVRSVKQKLFPAHSHRTIQAQLNDLPTPLPTNYSPKMSTNPLEDKAKTLATLSLHDPTNPSIQHTQTLHRLELLQHFDITPGSRLLELGCGQGDCTVVLADAVGEEGSVVAVDPAPLDYGSPYTLGQSQSHISQSPLGPRITFIQADPLSYLTTHPTTTPFTATLLIHSLFYFPSPATILQTLTALRAHSTRLHLAEWSLLASDPASQPHVLAVLAQAALECRKPESTSNIRTVLSPKRLTELAVQAGWRLEREGFVQPGEEVLDGVWEVKACLSERFGREVERDVGDERERGVVCALRDACEASLGVVEGVRAMDVWVGSFV